MFTRNYSNEPYSNIIGLLESKISTDVIHYELDIKSDPDDTEDIKVNPQELLNQHCSETVKTEHVKQVNNIDTSSNRVSCGYDMCNEFNVMPNIKCDTDVKQEICADDGESVSTVPKEMNHSNEVKQYQDHFNEFLAKYPNNYSGDQSTAKQNVKWYQCQMCDYRTKFKTILKRHFTVRHHEEAELCHCESCEFKTKNKCALSYHFEVDHDDSAQMYECELCEYTTTHKVYLENHFAMIHSEKAPWYHCQSCPFMTKYKKGLEKHITMKHNENYPLYHCLFCEYRVNNWLLLLDHHVKKHDANATVVPYQSCENESENKNCQPITLQKNMKQ